MPSWRAGWLVLSLGAFLAHGADAPEIQLTGYQALWNSRAKLFRSWVLVPSGILVILVACFGVDTFFKHFGVSFPASVACMLLLFAGLWTCELVAGSHRTRDIVAAIDVPVSWTDGLKTVRCGS